MRKKTRWLIMADEDKIWYPAVCVKKRETCLQVSI